MKADREHRGVSAAIDKAAEVIDRASSLALACHVKPDGDALGSMLAMHHVLRAAGRRSVASFPSPFVVPPHYREMPGLDLLVDPPSFPASPEVMVSFDCGSVSRLGDLEPAAAAAGELVVIDHHISNQAFGSVNVIDPEAASTGSVVHQLIERLGLPLNREAAVCLYTALVCDTGRFQYESTNAEVFDLARELVEFDVPVTRLSRQLFEEHRFAYLRLLGDALTRAELIPEERFVWTAVRRRDFDRFGVELDEVEGLIDILRRTIEADVACVLKQDHGEVRVSLRSLGDADVHLVAEAEGGGGHRYAAGFESTDPVEEIVGRIRAHLRAVRASGT